MPDAEQPLVPARMLNEFVYCPRLAILVMAMEAAVALSTARADAIPLQL